jgi:hypothetical protein
MAEAAHIEPAPAIVQFAGEAGSFMGDRAGDVAEVAQDAVENPRVTIHEDGGLERTTWWGEKKGQGTVVAAVALLGLLGYLRRRNSQ